MNVLTKSLGKLRQKRKLAEPQLPGLKREFRYTMAKDTETERGSSPQPLKSHS
jgi:hypothetical protein